MSPGTPTPHGRDTVEDEILVEACSTRCGHRLPSTIPHTPTCINGHSCRQPVSIMELNPVLRKVTPEADTMSGDPLANHPFPNFPLGCPKVLGKQPPGPLPHWSTSPAPKQRMHHSWTSASSKCFTIRSTDAPCAFHILLANVASRARPFPTEGAPNSVGTTAGNLCRFVDGPDGAEAEEGAFSSSGLDRLAMALPRKGREADSDGKHGTEPGRLLAEPKVI
ncbi:hypothetical protein I308_104004 [Cryptococcus tetragattii IND107]|uniref:Uncharacterized protein n=1 Tax=Cryptococcus tetragattii IND107 TaxID=1296105 RepID=A0ABR3BRY5_9TREE